MAKLLLLLESDDAPVLEASLIARAEALFGAEQHVTLQIMRALSDDVFYAPDSAYARPRLVVELVTSPGRPLQQLHDKLARLLRDSPVAASSQVFVMHERVYVDCAPQPLHYHYLMVRNPAFSAADYNDYYANFHCRFGLHTPAIEGYSQNYIDPAASAEFALSLGLKTRAVTSISEMKLPSVEAFLASSAMAELGPPAAADEARFVDRASSVSFCSQVVLRQGDFVSVREALFEQHFAD